MPAKPERLAIFLTLFLAGCGVDYRTAPVSGRITLDGEPLSDASVTFQPIGMQEPATPRGMGSYGNTGSDGRFSLMLIERDGIGAAVGMHRVQVSLPADISSDTSAGTPGDRVPARYRGAESELIFTVPKEGTTEANFDLKSKP
jgi:hypothetical protein